VAAAPESPPPLLVAASLVSSVRRSRRRAAAGASDASDLRSPPMMVAVTGQHRIVVVGKSGRDGVLCESPVRQYASRPGSASSFLAGPPPRSDGTDRGGPPVAVPAELDVRNDRVYALQRNNTRLVSWEGSGGGPDANCSPAALDPPAVSLSSLRQHGGRWSLACGALQNGAVFVARVAEGEKLEMRHLAPPRDLSLPPGAAAQKQHVGTIVHVLERKEPGTRRKSDNTGDKDALMIVQAFVDKVSFFFRW
jgi:hypothetical protein